jgi:hypothetical protein
MKVLNPQQTSWYADSLVCFHDSCTFSTINCRGALGLKSSDFYGGSIRAWTSLHVRSQHTPTSQFSNFYLNFSMIFIFFPLTQMNRFINSLQKTRDPSHQGSQERSTKKKKQQTKLNKKSRSKKQTQHHLKALRRGRWKFQVLWSSSLVQSRRPIHQVLSLLHDSHLHASKVLCIIFEDCLRGASLRLRLFRWDGIDT